MVGNPLLIVDDNPESLKLVRVLLNAEGYEALTAPNAEYALSLIEHFAPKLILMDIQLPGMDGLELTRHLKAQPSTRAIVIVAVTAFSTKWSEAQARAAGCDGYVTKPIDVLELSEIVAHHLLQQGS